MADPKTRLTRENVKLGTYGHGQQAPTRGFSILGAVISDCDRRGYVVGVPEPSRFDRALKTFQQHPSPGRALRKENRRLTVTRWIQRY